ncbi:MAG: propanediol utilization protein [Candidatus Kerfeldbacteria bacterium]|nr:propanediol utilization protein [Candidatus Kerfeldbacteria bacterium]
MKKRIREVPIEISSRHVHLTKAHVQKLFGRADVLRKVRRISQLGQFLCTQRVTLSNPFFTLPNVGIVGPERSKTQVELAITDARAFKISAPVRSSGDVAVSSGGITLHGPKGSIALQSGVIVIRRHIHASLLSAKRYGVRDGQTVLVRIRNPHGVRDVTLHDVEVRVRSDFKWALHLDTDEGNACGVGPKSRAEIMDAPS